MNIERLQAVRDAILNPPKGYEFNMSFFLGDGACGTTCCIAGFAGLLFEPYNLFTPYNTGRRVLDLSIKTADQLFYYKDAAGHALGMMASVTPAQAAATIDHLIATGEVVWVVP